MFALMTIQELYRQFVTGLKEIYSTAEAEQISWMVFESIAGITRPLMVREPLKNLDEDIVNRLKDCLTELQKHKPVQYVTGEAWFYNMKLHVSPAVLIPRPETEELAAALIQFLKDKPTATILDVGTGSGCIAIAAKKNLPNVKISAIDISEDALSVAKKNATGQGTDIEFIQLDFLDERLWSGLPGYDVIVSNPPYIPENEKSTLDKNVAAFEPHTALFVENNQPLVFYEKIALFGKEHLKPGGKIFLETHELYAAETAALFNDGCYSSFIQKDIFEKERMVIATRHSR
jgi:release factor glutamine methyltransferase